MDYLISNQFATVIIIHLLGVMSPGPDFLLVLKQSFSEGRKSALYTSIGIGLGILVHVILCVFGLGILISKHRKDLWIFISFRIDFHNLFRNSIFT